MYLSNTRSLLLLGALAELCSGVDVNNNLPTPWKSQGCYTEGSGTRALIGASYTNTTGMTEKSCITFCDSKNFIYAGAEYSSECYCGNGFMGGSAKTDLSDCSMGCSGNSSEACGAGNRLNVFWSGQKGPDPPVVNPGVAGWTSLGCYSDNVNGRALANGVQTTGGGTNMTIALCTSACKTGGYSYAGAEYGGECYCGKAIAGGSKSVTDGCTMICNGNGSEYCGGSNRLNAYRLGAAPPSSSGGGASDAPTSTSATSVNPGATGLPTGWDYKGCWVDNKNGAILAKRQTDDPDATVESCVNVCKTAGYKVAGIEYSTQCSCGNSIIEGGTKGDEADCSMSCGGNDNEKCGGPNRMSIYAIGNLNVIGVPVPQNTSLPGSFQYAGCYTEGANKRALPWQIIDATNNSATACCTQCAKFGYMTCGLEYGEECYCGDDRDLTAVGSIKAPESDCATACPGNASYICGGGNRLTTYRWSGNDPLYTWNYPQGNSAGAYRNFIGGVVIPLITVPGINGKITMVEKYGTSTSGNSSGAYELDPSLSGNFSAAWREMHGFKTDVFCSAGLVLPDKAGRVINIGGWSGDSTYGLRFYTPDGAPGKASVNEWEENYDEIHLQAGRWYPSAMQLVNGSILVVGGEDGSNGKPVPSLEILPKAGGTVYCDWLERTDPNNLYPYLAVLPGGGIFVAYYNEARILDAGTFGTVKTLPGIPGSVTGPDSGRTYPFEGTAMLMPQYAPYSDPLEILICGGSGPGVAIALDNCVTIAPEAANPEWTLERMPSKRVMSCITALPDGTYLILNGAQQGVAGFGLATDPNLNAVLYDPSKPFGSRMSIMANTTVARLYHSEAVLMDDGRVLVTGSDPEDGVHPQEYRVEVFIPPYILNGKARPSYTITNKDWNYGQSVPITVTIPSGNTANVKISMLGAVASTHGNSMGQRTLFPAFSCSGTTCTITAPPRANIAPMGWFQLFVLDGGIPSTAQWVRLGGDPGKLGNWPDFPDFSTPGV